METLNKKSQNIAKLVDNICGSSPAVDRWCRMCHVGNVFLLLSMQKNDSEMHQTEIFRKIIGYLMQPPKRHPGDEFFSEAEWSEINWYSHSERKRMCSEFGRFLDQFREWMVTMDMDELAEDASDAQNSFGEKMWKYLRDLNPEAIFKVQNGHYHFRRKAIKQIGNAMDNPPIEPLCDRPYLKSMANDESSEFGTDFERSAVRLLGNISANTSVMASEAKTDGQIRKRVGTDEEIAQENEIIRRVRDTHGKNIRWHVCAVLRSPEFQKPGGHPYTQAGISQCYHRVYAILNPGRRKR